MIRLLTFLALIACLAAPAAFALPDFRGIVERHGGAVVNISTTQKVRVRSGPPATPFDDPLLQHFFGQLAPRHSPRDLERQSAGSGFIISPDGYILTNAHVVERADDILVRLSDRREFKARVVGGDRRTDVALLKIEAGGLPAITAGDPARLQPGEWVLAIGAPFGLDNSVTAGIVSAIGRNLPSETFVPFIQTDVAINPGNSGGPLFNLHGEVVGINSQIYSRTGGYMGLSFAIPIDVAMQVAQQIKATGRVRRGYLGIGIQEVSRDLARSFNLSAPRGALIGQVAPGSPAQQAGLKAGDIVLKANGRLIGEPADLSRLVAGLQPGQPVTLNVWRRGAALTLQAQAGELKEDAPASGVSPAQSASRVLGLSLAPLPQALPGVPEEGGVLIEDVEGAAAGAGVRPGDILLALENTRVHRVEDVTRLAARIRPGQVVQLLLYRNGRSLFAAFSIPDGER